MRTLQTKTAGNGLETEHKYNIQGWLSGITHRIKAPPVNLQTGDTLRIRNIIFTEQLNYFKPQAAKPLYSGNIAEISWHRGRDVMGDNTYAYSYDMLGRLTDAELYKREPSENFPGFSLLRDNTFTERRMEYDLNGNMRSFERYNGDEIHKYKYLLDGNQLVRVKCYPGTKDSEGKVAFGIEEADNPFEYDAMGNLVYDGQNQLKISYDFLNLPQKIAPAELHSQAGELFLANYCYLWNGEKIASADVRESGYLYIGSVRYSLDSAKPAFESAPFAMGRIGRLDEEYDTRYFLNDHLGSVRAIVNQDGVVTAEYDYMPYGMQHKNSSLATSDDNTFRYNGKELQSRFCVDLYDSQARLQGMNARFNSIDPLAGEMPHVSPYVYCAGNPIFRIDPTGLASETPYHYNWETGQYEDASGHGVVWGTVWYYLKSSANEFVEKQVQKFESRLDNAVNNGSVATASVAMTAEFIFGIGPEKRDFDEEHIMTQSLKNSYMTKVALRKFWAAYSTGHTPTHYRVDWGPVGLFYETGVISETWHDRGFSTPQFTGTATYFFNINGNNLNITVKDDKNERSLLFHFPGTDRHTRDENKFMGKTSQSYTFSVPLSEIPQLIN